MISFETIERFIAGNCSSDEEKAVIRHFEENSPEDTDLYKSGEVLMNEKFNLPLSKDVSARILDKVYLNIIGKRKYRRRWVTAISAVAAVIILVIGVKFFFASQSPAPLSSFKEVAQSQISKTNSSSANEIIQLTDGSQVTLNPGSTIDYLSGFESDRRDISLSGEAFFKVAKDSTRPFTVFSQKVSTTALGTEFRIKSTPDDILITLYKGKILVKEINKVSEKYYLTAGNSISYDVLSEHFSMIIRLKEETAKPIYPKSMDLKKQSINLTLNNTSLKSALDQLAEKFDVEIEYSPGDIYNINIIATITPAQSIERILENITQINGLTLIKVSSKKFLIRKSSN